MLIEQIQWAFMFVGAVLLDSLEIWVWGLVVLIILLDFIVGIRHRPLLVFSLLQLVGLIAGYYFVKQVYLENDIAGPYAAAFVVGIWGISTILFHVAYLALRLLKNEI